MKNYFNEFGLEATKNLYGYMHSLSQLGETFIEYSKNKLAQPVLDIGCAYGVTTIPCLVNNTAVIACDIEAAHLEELKRRTPEKYLDLLSLKCCHFPNELDLEKNSISAVILSHVLSFLTREEIQQGFYKLNQWLCAGGKIFILNYTPYHRTISAFIPDYEARIKIEKTFAGEIHDKRQYSTKELISSVVPNRLMLFDKETLSFLLHQNGFEIEYLEYLGGTEAGVPEPLCLDGREWIAAIGVKK